MMKPGRELDAVVSRVVMGWAPGAEYDANGDWRCPAFSTEIEAAWQVVEKLWPNHRLFLYQHYKRKEWRADFHPRDSVLGKALESDGLTAPHAICNAAIIASLREE